MIGVVGLLALIYLILIGLRAFFGLRFFALASRLKHDQSLATQVTVLQPILSGDPTLATCLEANLRAHPLSLFLWLVDEDDPGALTCVDRLRGLSRVEVLVGPAPADGENPKMTKLARGFAQVTTPFCAVLDDDTMLPPGALDRAASALVDGGIACGLPLYVNGTTLWSRLVAGFVNGASLITYPTAACLNASRTLNGMFYVVKTHELRALGGFSSLVSELTDDYAIAQLYLDSGRKVLQTDVVHPISTSVPDARAYLALMHRWMIFASRYVSENQSLFTVGLIGGSTILPIILLLMGMISASTPITIAALTALAAKVSLTAYLRRRFTGRRTSLLDVAYEIAADVLTPLHLLHALARPDTFTWRRRTITLRDGHIDYK